MLIASNNYSSWERIIGDCSYQLVFDRVSYSRMCLSADPATINRFRKENDMSKNALLPDWQHTKSPTMTIRIQARHRTVFASLTTHQCIVIIRRKQPNCSIDLQLNRVKVLHLTHQMSALTAITISVDSAEFSYTLISRPPKQSPPQSSLLVWTTPKAFSWHVSSQHKTVTASSERTGSCCCSWQITFSYSQNFTGFPSNKGSLSNFLV